MLANTITLSRLLLTFVVIVLFKRNPFLNIACLVTIAIIFALDAIDGIVARKRNETSEFGAAFDISADRIIENVFWIYFTAVGHIPVWIPIIVITRGILTDTLQRYSTSPKSKFAHILTRSCISRGTYGALKMLTVLYLSWLHLYTPENLVMKQVGLILATATVAICLIRGIPVIIAAWKDIKPSENPTNVFSVDLAEKAKTKHL